MSRRLQLLCALERVLGPRQLARAARLSDADLEALALELLGP